jgi:uncharacterized membrane protein YfcA
MEYFLLLLAGLLCGFFNTVASSGSAVTLPFLIFMGLPPAVANGTNRLPVLVGSVVATISFLRAGLIEPRIALRILVPTVAGSVCGVMLAEHLPHNHLHLLVMMAVVVALGSVFSLVKRALLRAFDLPPRLGRAQMALLFAVGFWLGLIVLDGAAFLLLTLILSVRMPLATANAYKNLVLAVTSAIAVLQFALNDHIDWKIGGVLAAGSIVGGLIGARLALAPAAKIWTYRLLVTIIVVELLHMVWHYLN